MANNEITQEFTTKGVASAGRQIFSLIDALKGLLGISDKATKALKEVAEAEEKAGDKAKEAGDDMEEGGKGAAKMQTFLGKLLTSMKRIAFYRAIRSAIRSITQGFREGIQHVYQYSASLNSLDAARAKNTMDEFATSAMYVKNSLGAALMPILQSLVPVVNWIADAFVTAANAVNQFWSALQGKSVFTKAKRQAVEYADALGGAAGAAKELKKQIFGFDELNIFNSPSGGGGGGGTGLDFSSMFEEAEIDGVLKSIRDRIEKNLGKDFSAKFTINFKDFFVKWGDLTGEDIANKILGGLYGLLFGITGFTIAGPLGAIVGTIAGVALGVGIATATITPDGQLTETEVGEMMRFVAATFTGGLVGWVVGGPNGALLGASIAASLSALIKTFAPEPAATLEGLTVMGFFAAVIAKMISAAKGATVLKAGIGGIPMLVVAGITLSVMSLLWEHGYKDTRQAVGMAIAEAINVIAAAAVLGAWFGGPGGALIGLAVGVGINLVVNKIDWSGVEAVSKRAQDYMDSKIDINAMNNYLGSPASTGNTINGKKVRQSILKGEAEGGYVPPSTLFYAGERGPELVGVVGGRSHVTNQEQFTAGMEDIMDNTNSVILQAAQAIVQAVVNKPVASFSLNDRDVVSMYDRGKTLAGEALVG